MIQVSGFQSMGLSGSDLLPPIACLFASLSHSPTQSQALRVTRHGRGPLLPESESPGTGGGLSAFLWRPSFADCSRPDEEQETILPVHPGVSPQSPSPPAPRGWGPQGRSSPCPPLPVLPRGADFLKTGPDLVISSFAEFREDLKQDVYSSSADDRGIPPKDAGSQ